MLYIKALTKGLIKEIILTGNLKESADRKKDVIVKKNERTCGQ